MMLKKEWERSTDLALLIFNENLGKTSKTNMNDHYILHNRTEFRCPSVFPILPILQSPSHRLTLSQIKKSALPQQPHPQW
jgi:hypothetical protein